MTFKPWYAQEAKIGIATVVASVNSTQTLKTQFEVATDELYFTGRAKDLSITGGGRDFTKVEVMGTNELGQEERSEFVQIEMTLVYDESNSASWLAGSANTSFTVSEGTTRTYYRYKYGEKTLSTIDRQKKAILVVFDDRMDTAATAQKVNILLNNAYCTGRELSLAADGHVEEKVTFKCFSSDYYEEDNYAYTTWST